MASKPCNSPILPKPRTFLEITPRLLRGLTIATLVLASMVVLAGSVVRMTGSGMGCPDWPKCFGLAIPPTSVDEVTWTAGETYATGRMLLSNDTLWVAQSTIQAQNFEQERKEGLWDPYTRHDYALFNPLHTWVEFINRLIGALTGIPALFLALGTFLFGWRQKRWRPFMWALGNLVLLGLVAWMGKKVVDGNLIPFSITLHMLGAVAILLVLTAAWMSLATPWTGPGLKRRPWLLVALVLTTIQLIGGTQVREQVDVLSHAGLLRADWLDALPHWWKWHRTSSWLILGVQLFWAWPNRMGVPAARSSMALVLLQMITGILFVYASMPPWTQPMHLALAMALLVSNGWAWMRCGSGKN
jgi:heme a synthase